MAATDSQANEGPPLTELESLQLKANQVTDESLESTRRMIALCEDVSKFSRLLWIKLYKYLKICSIVNTVLLFLYFVTDSLRKQELRPWSHWMIREVSLIYI